MAIAILGWATTSHAIRIESISGATQALPNCVTFTSMDAGRVFIRGDIGAIAGPSGATVGLGNNWPGSINTFGAVDNDVYLEVTINGALVDSAFAAVTSLAVDVPGNAAFDVPYGFESTLPAGTHTLCINSRTTTGTIDDETLVANNNAIVIYADEFGATDLSIIAMIDSLSLRVDALDVLIPLLQAEITNNTTNIAGNTTSIGDLETAVTILQSTIQDILDDVADHETRIQLLEQCVALLKQAMEDLEDRVTTNEGDIAFHSVRINALEIAMASLQVTVQGINTTIISIQNDVADHETRIQLLEQCVAILKALVEDLEDRVTVNETNIQTLLIRQSELAILIANNTGDIAALTLEITNIETTLLSMIAIHEARLDALEVTVGGLTLTVENLLTLITNLDQDVADLTLRLTLLEQAHFILNEIVLTLTEQVNNNEQAIAGLQVSVSSNTQRITINEASIAALELTVEALAECVAQLKIRMTAAELAILENTGTIESNYQLFLIDQIRQDALIDGIVSTYNLVIERIDGIDVLLAEHGGTLILHAERLVGVEESILIHLSRIIELERQALEFAHDIEHLQDRVVTVEGRIGQLEATLDAHLAAGHPDINVNQYQTANPYQQSNVSSAVTASTGVTQAGTAGLATTQGHGHGHGHGGKNGKDGDYDDLRDTIEDNSDDIDKLGKYMLYGAGAIIAIDFIGDRMNANKAAATTNGPTTNDFNVYRRVPVGSYSTESGSFGAGGGSYVTPYLGK